MARRKTDNPRKKFVAVWCTPEEKERIKQKAAMCGTKTGPFIRDLALEYPLTSRVDQYAVDQLLQAKADLGRLGGLFKLWLTKNEDFKESAKLGNRSYQDVEDLVRDLEANEKELVEIAKRLMKGSKK
jgi:hypothetical protein